MAGFYEEMVKDFKSFLDEMLGAPAYYEGGVPLAQEYPYGVFSVQFLDVGRGLGTLNFFYRDSSMKQAMDIVDRITSEVKYTKHYKSLLIDGGDPIAQMIPADDTFLKQVYMTFNLRHLVSAESL